MGGLVVGTIGVRPRLKLGEKRGRVVYRSEEWGHAVDLREDRGRSVGCSEKRCRIIDGSDGPGCDVNRREGVVRAGVGVVCRSTMRYGGDVER